MVRNVLHTKDIGDLSSVTECYFAYIPVGKILVRYAG